MFSQEILEPTVRSSSRCNHFHFPDAVMLCARVCVLKDSIPDALDASVLSEAQARGICVTSPSKASKASEQTAQV